jgi:hypothetical protein
MHNLNPWLQAMAQAIAELKQQAAEPTLPALAKRMAPHLGIPSDGVLAALTAMGLSANQLLHVVGARSAAPPRAPTAATPVTSPTRSKPRRTR